MTSVSSFINALDNLEAYVLANGPFDGVMAYSQGAGLIAMLLVRRQYLLPQEKSLFKCAILFCPLQVYDPVAYLERGEVNVLSELAPGTSRLSIPIAIIYGKEDERKHESIAFQGMCDPNLLSVYMHEGGHEVPSIAAKDGGLRETVKMARRAITQAELALTV